MCKIVAMVALVVIDWFGIGDRSESKSKAEHEDKVDPDPVIYALWSNPPWWGCFWWRDLEGVQHSNGSRQSDTMYTRYTPVRHGVLQHFDWQPLPVCVHSEIMDSWPDPTIPTIPFSCLWEMLQWISCSCVINCCRFNINVLKDYGYKKIELVLYKSPFLIDCWELYSTRLTSVAASWLGDFIVNFYFSLLYFFLLLYMSCIPYHGARVLVENWTFSHIEVDMVVIKGNLALSRVLANLVENCLQKKSPINYDSDSTNNSIARSDLG